MYGADGAGCLWLIVCLKYVFRRSAFSSSDSALVVSSIRVSIGADVCFWVILSELILLNNLCSYSFLVVRIICVVSLRYFLSCSQLSWLFESLVLWCNLLRFLICCLTSLFIQGTSPGRMLTFLFGMLSEAAFKIELAIVSAVASTFGLFSMNDQSLILVYDYILHSHLCHISIFCAGS